MNIENPLNDAVERLHTKQLQKVFANWNTVFSPAITSNYLKYSGSNGGITFEAQGNVKPTDDKSFDCLYGWQFYYKGERIMKNQDVSYRIGSYGLDFVKEFYGPEFVQKTMALDIISGLVDELTEVKCNISDTMIKGKNKTAKDINKLLAKKIKFIEGLL